MDFAAVGATIFNFGSRVAYALQRLPAILTTADSWVITLEMPARAVPVDPSLSYWSGTDRFWAIIAGYITLSLLGAAYLKKGSPFSTSQVGREWEATLIDILNQAGGVTKVILIISIEMLVFPLYCGLLLDLALLPLFENATILSRIVFTIDSPLTSIFVHWFVGTCYMFHFALFVSMCRKIMRNGVLCK
jgi:E3 ubiquitin-protein ligase MARCH6